MTRATSRSIVTASWLAAAAACKPTPPADSQTPPPTTVELDPAEPAPVADEPAPEGSCAATEGGVDLGTLVDRPACIVQGEATPVAAGSLSAAISPAPLDLADGSRAELRVYVTSTAAAPQSIDFQLGCDPWRGFDLRAEDAKKKSTHSFIPGSVYDGEFSAFCGKAARCARLVVRVQMDPGTKIYVPLQLDTEAREFDEGCGLVDVPSLAKGTYTLTATVPVVGEPLTGTGVLRVP